MASDPVGFTEDLPDPGWRERIGAVKRAAKALLATRAEIFREELAGKGSLFGQAAAALTLALAFAALALVLLTALVAAVLARLLGGPIAGLAAALFLYLLIAAGAAFFGVKRLGRVRPFEFPVTRDELSKDLEAVRDDGALHDEGPASPEALAAERASIRPGENDEEREERDEEMRANENLEERFRAGSE
ncbi:MAG TPA: phage holin family protein [Thermoanaerobaculia bacterium]|jgi:uncharacterized membrane protein YqjE|nr:phage holin family protein [Thermoanaerobaculia bacterium]